jgi:hypothetical protein
MPKSRTRKNHKQKVSNRNSKIKQEKEKLKRKQQDFLMKLIESEKNRGLFDKNTDGPTIEDVNIEGPTI